MNTYIYCQAVFLLICIYIYILYIYLYIYTQNLNINKNPIITTWIIIIIIIFLSFNSHHTTIMLNCIFDVTKKLYSPTNNSGYQVCVTVKEPKSLMWPALLDNRIFMGTDGNCTSGKKPKLVLLQKDSAILIILPGWLFNFHQ